MNSKVRYHQRRLADVAAALRLARTQASREQGPRARLAHHQQQRLDTVVRHAATHSPFYRRRLAGTDGLGAGPVELQRLPVLDKSLLMEHFDELVCDPRLRRDRLLDWCCAAPSLVMGAAVPLVMRAGRPGGMAVGMVVIGSGCGGAHGLDGGRGHRVWVVGCG